MTYEEAKHIVAVRHKLGTTLVTGHKAAYFEEAARIYAENEIYAAVGHIAHRMGITVDGRLIQEYIDKQKRPKQ